MEAGADADKATQEELEGFVALGEVLLAVEFQSTNGGGKAIDEGGRIELAAVGPVFQRLDPLRKVSDRCSICRRA